MNLEKTPCGTYTAKDIEKKELCFIRNLILATENPCKLCLENPETCGLYGVEYRLCNSLVNDIDNEIPDE